MKVLSGDEKYWESSREESPLFCPNRKFPPRAICFNSGPCFEDGACGRNVSDSRTQTRPIIRRGYGEYGWDAFEKLPPQ
jgi:hypothetical protein